MVSTIHAVLAALIRLLHVLFVVWMVWAPFSGRPEMVFLHAFVVPSLFLHWALNNDTCALTVAESYLLGKEPGETFFGQLVGPVYKLPDTQLTKIVKLLTLLLWCRSLAWLWQASRTQPGGWRAWMSPRYGRPQRGAGPGADETAGP